MTAKNRAGLITKLQTALKKHFKPAAPSPGRPLLEHILYAALLEDAPVDLADEGFAKCEQEFFDWNEVRVTSVTELAEVFSNFPAPAATALRLKRCLQSVFEAFYSFEIDHFKKENLGKAVAKFETMNGFSPFVMAYLVQHGLGGHAIPVNSNAISIMHKAGIVSDSEARSGKVPGLERAIPKNKAIEFASTLHQAAVAIAADALAKEVWDVILAVNKDASPSVPETTTSKRVTRADKSPAAKQPAVTKPAAASKSPASDGKPETGGKPTAVKKVTSKSKAEASTPAKPAPAQPVSAKPVSAKPAPAKPAPTKATADQPPAVAASGKPKIKATEVASDSGKGKDKGKSAASSAKPASDKAKKSVEAKALPDSSGKATTGKPKPKAAAEKPTATESAADQVAKEKAPADGKPAKPVKKTASKSPASGKPASSADTKPAKLPSVSSSAQKITKRKPR